MQGCGRFGHIELAVFISKVNLHIVESHFRFCGTNPFGFKRKPVDAIFALLCQGLILLGDGENGIWGHILSAEGPPIKHIAFTLGQSSHSIANKEVATHGKITLGDLSTRSTVIVVIKDSTIDLRVLGGVNGDSDVIALIPSVLQVARINHKVEIVVALIVLMRIPFAIVLIHGADHVFTVYSVDLNSYRVSRLHRIALLDLDKDVSIAIRADTSELVNRWIEQLVLVSEGVVVERQQWVDANELLCPNLGFVAIFEIDDNLNVTCEFAVLRRIDYNAVLRLLHITIVRECEFDLVAVGKRGCSRLPYLGWNFETIA